jgi:hypothetical protein
MGGMDEALHDSYPRKISFPIRPAGIGVEVEAVTTTRKEQTRHTLTHTFASCACAFLPNNV